MLYEYVDLTTFKAGIHAKAGSTNNDDEFVRLNRVACRYVDRRTRRGEGGFHAQTETRYFDGNGCASFWLPPGNDLLSVTTLKVDQDGDGVFETTLSPSDYWKLPLNSRDHYYQLHLNPSGSLGVFPSGVKRVEIAGVWGWADDSVAVSQLAAAIADTTGTSVTVDQDSGISRGHIVQVDDEQMYVADVNATTLTVVRGVNGTTAAAHDDDSAVSLRLVPEDIAQAVIMYAGRVWRRSESGFAQVLTQASEVGVYQVFRSVDPDVAQFLAPYDLAVVA